MTLQSQIKETQNYFLAVGTSKVDDSKCYQIFNKKYGVMEIESHILPQALKYLDDVEAGLAAVVDMSIKVPKSVISGLN